MKPLDKKQIPQVAALAVLAVAFFGYFVLKLILPTPAAARTQVTATAVKPRIAATPAPDAAALAFTAPPPSAGMHDPFVQEVSDQPVPPAPASKPAPAVHTASLKSTGLAPLAIPFVPALPSATIKEQKTAALGGVSLGGASSGIPPLPVAPAAPVAPLWTVTGVLQSGSEHVAILRSGAARRFVKQGDYVDSEFVVTSVTRDAVILRHGHSRFMLPLGGSKAVPAAAVKTSPVSETTADPRAASTEGVPDGKPRLKAMKRMVPRIARLSTSRDTHPGPPTLARQSLFSFPLAVHSPTVRVAEYQSEKALPLFPLDGVRGLLPSGMEAPDFSLSTTGGQSFSLSQFRGNVVVLDFWASWDAPSVRSLSTLEQLQKDLGAQGLTVLTVNSWDSEGGMQVALQGSNVQGSDGSLTDGSMTQLYDPSVSNESVAVRLYRAPDVSTFYVIDREGRIAGAFVGCGPNTISSIQATLAKLGILSQEKTL